MTAWLDGDRDAFATIYDRYADGLYGFAMSRLRNRTEAADAVQETFVRAAGCLAQLRDRSRLRAWLYAIARNRVIDARRRPMSHVDDEEFAEMPAEQPELADVAARSEVAELVWLAADGLTPRDRELLGLHLRHGLDGADLADVVGVSPANLYVSMNRLKERMAKAVGALLIARHGSKDCPELSAVLAGWDGTFTLDVRSRVTRHVESCAQCATRRAALITTASFSAGSLAVPFGVPAHVRATMLDRLGSEVQPFDGEPYGASRDGRRRGGRRDGWRSDGFPTVGGGGSRRGATMLAVAAAGVVLIAATALYVNADRGGRSVTSPPESVLAQGLPDSAPATGSATEDLASPGAQTTVDPVVATTVVETTAAGAPAAATSTSLAPLTPDTVGAMHSPAPTATSPLVPAETTIPTGIATAVPPPTSPSSPSSSPAPPATTAPDVAAPTPSSAPDSTAVDTTAGVPTTQPPPPPPPGRIVVISNPIVFDLSEVAKTARLRNDGGQSVGWSAAAGLVGFAVSPASGTLAAGEAIDVQISVNRAALPEGTPRTDVTVTSPGGGGSVSVEARVERAPVIGPLNRTPPLVRNSGSCGPTLVSLSITASDESGIASVEVVWSSDGSFAQRTALASNGAGAYVGSIGSFSKIGTNNFTAHVLDTRGNAATASASVVVMTC